MRTIEEVTKDIADYWIYNLSNSEIKTADDECSYLKGLLNEILEIHKAEKRPRGRWLKARHDVYCNRCDYHKAFESNFCPHCGADMRGSEWV